MLLGLASAACGGAFGRVMIEGAENESNPSTGTHRMAELIIPDVDAAMLERLSQLASRHGRTTGAEAKVILSQALQASPPAAWDGVDAIRNRLAATGKVFSDSADLVREDRGR